MVYDIIFLKKLSLKIFFLNARYR